MSWAFETLVATGLLMALVLLLRRPVARMFGARAALALWAAPVMRLVFPPTPIAMPIETLAVELDVAASVAPVAAAAWTPGLFDLLSIIWLGGAVIFLGWHALAYRRFVTDAVSRGQSVAVTTIKDAAVLATPAVTGPAATGLIIRRIFVPADFESKFSKDEQRLALAHEALHHRRGDLWFSGAGLILLSFHWFNPLAHFAHRAFRRDLEAACDASLLDQCGREFRPAYARTILRCAGQPMPQTSCALTPLGELKGRLEMLNLQHGKGHRLAGTIVAAALAAGGLTLAYPVAAQDPPKEETSERTEIRRVYVDKVSGDRTRRGVPSELREKMAKCDGEKFESEIASEPADPKKARNRILICAKAGTTKAETAAALEKVLSRLEGDSEMPAENKAQITARLKARIAELKAGS